MRGLAGSFAAPLWLAASLLAGCAGNQPPPEVVDPVIVPELAVEVGRVSLYNADEWTHLNRRMIVLWSGRSPYLLVFNTPCRGLGGGPWVLGLSSTGSTLEAGFDSLRFKHDPPCVIDAMYRIQREDVKALQEALSR
jgi:hypothetical protein